MMRHFMIMTTKDKCEYWDLYEFEDFHAAAEGGLSIANEEGSRLSEIDEALEIPVDDGTPKIGIFWRVQASDGDVSFLVDMVPMSEAEPYGEFLTHGGHYEHWTRLAAMSARELSDRLTPEVVRWTEYDEWPRGRVVFHQPTDRFILYADRKLQTPAIIKDIISRFSLPADRTAVRSDEHYASVR